VVSYPWLHPASRQAAANFGADLARIAGTMRDRNSQRPPALRYGYLMPENILNSISI
jgi:hypothetical protein